MRVEAANLKAIIPGNLLCKYANDTFIIIPACNSHTRKIELEHTDSLAKLNNLTVNRAKTVEVILLTRRASVQPPHRYLCLALHDALHSKFLKSQLPMACQRLNTSTA